MKKPVSGNAKSNTPRSVADGFTEFSAKLISTFSESEVAETNLSIIERCLSANFDMTYLAPYGSFGHGTNVSEYSTVDCFAVIPKAKLFESSSESLAAIKEALVQKLPDTTITEGRPVLAIPFGEAHSERHHIVPAFQQGSTGAHDLFAIPAPSDRWVGVCPAAHSIWINEIDKELNQNLKPFIRIVKAWNHYNKTPFWSYYLELCVADFLKKDTNIVYSSDLNNFFKYMLNRRLDPFEATEGCTEPVYGTSIADKKTALDTLIQASSFSQQACAWEARGNIHEAFYYWRKMFDWRFSAY